ncbi:acyl-CoA dehydrogenase-like protein [Paenibacillus sp. JCM 10914]|uniref:acyl-CoA dehydrogenase-like protein n=1 Tax=Paenibacillus sp. JCM 10914 TaxID=1236974 RepID=UPI0003CCA743|nr:acyl-CoA dehydrogenase-like protein [Paenibacillus sp. JCM 10914]GAE08912.1 acyl-CoA dehydrogenase-like protein [Paenibacillus sp. JCM 10914]
MLFYEQQIESIRSLALDMDKSRQVPPEVLNIIYDLRLFHLFVPDELEGRMTTLPDAARIFQEASRVDGNLGWLVTIGAGGGFFAALMNPDVNRMVFARREAVIAGSGMPTGTAKRVDGGYRVSGSWKYCSGSTYATTFTANAVIERNGVIDKEEPEIRSFIFRADEIQVEPDWNAFGLRATASHTITAHDVMIPESMSFSLNEIKGYQSELIYQYPFLPFAQVSFAAVATGIAEHLLAAAEKLAIERGSAAHIRDTITSASTALTAAITSYYAAIEASWTELQERGQLSAETETKVSSSSLHAASVARHCGEQVFPLLGLSAAMEDSEVNRCWRDLQTACSHSLLRTEL